MYKYTNSTYTHSHLVHSISINKDMSYKKGHCCLPLKHKSTDIFSKSYIFISNVYTLIEVYSFNHSSVPLRYQSCQV